MKKLNIDHETLQKFRESLPNPNVFYPEGEFYALYNHLFNGNTYEVWDFLIKSEFARGGNGYYNFDNEKLGSYLDTLLPKPEPQPTPEPPQATKDIPKKNEKAKEEEVETSEQGQAAQIGKKSLRVLSQHQGELESHTKTIDLFDVSFFRTGIKQTKPTNTASIKNIFDKIKNRSWEKQIEKIREIWQATKDKEQVAPYKNKLPYFTPCGVFSYRSNDNLLTHNGLISIDIDDDKNNDFDLATAQSQLYADPYTFAGFVSPKGEGLKLFVRIPVAKDDKELKASYYALESYYLHNYGYIIDEACKDIARACFVSSDANLFLNEDAPIFNEKSEAPRKDAPKNNPKPLATRFEVNGNFDYDNALYCATELKRLNIDITASYNDWIAVGFSLASLGEQGRELFHLASSSHPTYTNAETDKKFRELLKSQKGAHTLGTFFDYCKKVGVNFKDRFANELPCATQKTPHSKHRERDNEAKNIFSGNKVNEAINYAKTLPKLKKMFSSLIHTNELVVLFADNGIGKSMLAVQIAEAIAEGKEALGMRNECQGQPVVYYDFELSERVWLSRYTHEENGNIYEFSEKLIRRSINTDALKELPATNYTKILIQGIEQDLEDFGSKFIIIDNVTGINLNDLADGASAMELMRDLDTLKKRTGITILILAHTPKVPEGQPITKNHLAGSKVLSNFIDASFALGKSTNDKNLKYLKQIKSRLDKEEFGGDNIVRLQLKRFSNGFLGFENLGFDTERSMLMSYEEKQKAREEGDLIASIRDYRNQGLSLRAIAQQLELSLAKVQRIIKSNGIV